MLQSMHWQGLCVSYDQLKALSTDIANSVINHCKQIGLTSGSSSLVVLITLTMTHHGKYQLPMENASAFNSTSFQTANKLRISLTSLIKLRWGRSMWSHCQLATPTMDLNVSLLNDEVLHVPAPNIKSSSASFPSSHHGYWRRVPVAGDSQKPSSESWSWSWRLDLKGCILC